MSLLNLISIIMSIAILILGNIVGSAYITAVATILIWLAFFLKMLKAWKKSVLVCLYLICFFSFLLGTPLMKIIGLGEFMQEKELEIFSLNMVYLSLCAIWLGCVVCEKIRITNFEVKHSILKDNADAGVKAFEKPAMFLFWITYPLYVLNYMVQNNFVKVYGYLEYYKSYTGASSIVSYGNIACIFAFYLFLACFPSKKKAMPVIIAYIIANVLSINAGQRTGMVVAIVFSIYYMFLRQGRSEEVWIKRSYILLGIILVPVFFAFLGYWAFYRTETVDASMNVNDYIVSFVNLNGGSSALIGYAYKLKDSLKELGYHSYTFGYLIRLFTGSNYGQSTLELANSGTSLGASITYLINPYTFLKGGGLGTCYIAELWIDFGVIGVAIYNLILGYVIQKMSMVRFKNTIGALLSFAIIQELFTLPRREALCMLPFFTSRVFIILLIIIIFFKNSQSNSRFVKSFNK